MPRKKKLAGPSKRPEMPREWFLLLRDLPLPEDANKFRAWQFDDEAPRLWMMHGEEIMAQWAERRAGTRPSCWWKFTAPEPRQRIGGKGTSAPRYAFGMPTGWLSNFDVDCRHGEARNVRTGELLEQLCAIDLSAEKFDPNDPPRFESEATFLKRLGLLMRGELSRIPKSAFTKPETLPREFWPYDFWPGE